MADPPEPVDARADRAAQGVIAVLLLGAFVFKLWPLVPVVGAIVAVGAALGPSANGLLVGFSAVIAPRIPAPSRLEEPATIRLQDLLAAALLVLASLWFLVGVSALGWLFSLVEAGVALAAATTGYHAAIRIFDRFRRRPA